VLWIASDINPDSFLRPYKPPYILNCYGFRRNLKRRQLGG